MRIIQPGTIMPYANASNPADAHRAARNFADAGRYQPGTDEFNNALSKLQQINNWDSGAALKVKAGFIHAEMQINLTENWLSQTQKCKRPGNAGWF